MAAVVKSVDETINKCQDLNKFITEGYQLTKGIAEDFEDVESGKDLVNDLRTIMVEYTAMERDITQYCSAARVSLGKFKTEYATCDDEEQIPNLPEIFDSTLHAMRSTNTDEQLQQNKEVKDFTETVWRLHNPDVSIKVQQQQAHGSEGDDEVEISQMDDTNKYICPITKVELVDPVKVKLCGHTYSRKAIEAHIRSMGARAKCPIPGCLSAVVITQADLETNNVLAFELRKRNRNV